MVLLHFLLSALIRFSVLVLVLVRAITDGVAATMSDEMRRMQLANLNAVASSMVPPAPDLRARGLAPTGPKPPIPARPPASSNSLRSLYNKLNNIVSRDDQSRPSSSADVPASQSSVLSQQSEGVLLSVGRVAELFFNLVMNNEIRF